MLLGRKSKSRVELIPIVFPWSNIIISFLSRNSSQSNSTETLFLARSWSKCSSSVKHSRNIDRFVRFGRNILSLGRGGRNINEQP